MEKERLDGLRKFVVPEFVFGWGARALLGQYAKNFAFRHALVVSDAGVISAGWTGDATTLLQSASIPFSLFSQVTSNPKDHEVMAGADFYTREKCDALIAVGGGSAIDTAKGIGIIIANGGHILDYEGVDKISFPIPPLLCIPTTAGTSADVSQLAIITNCAEKNKIAIISKAIVPDVSLIDPETTTTLDPLLTANTAMDALCHAIEAVASNARSPITDLLALEAIRLIFKNLAAEFAAREEASIKRERIDMMLASLLAGMAFSNASLGLIHAMSHSLGGLLNSPHGQCNSFLIDLVVFYNFEAAQEQYRRIGEAMGLDLKGMDGEKIKKSLIDAIKQLKKEIGLEKTLADLAVPRDAIHKLAINAIKDPCLVTNPRQPTLNEIESLYERAF